MRTTIGRAVACLVLTLAAVAPAAAGQDDRLARLEAEQAREQEERSHGPTSKAPMETGGDRSAPS